MCVTFLHYISDEKMKTSRDQVTTQSNLPVKKFVLLNSVDSQHPSFKVITVELEVSLYCVKNRLIAGERNCGYSPFLSAVSSFVDFLFSSNMKNMTLLLYIHIVIIVGELSKDKK